IDYGCVYHKTEYRERRDHYAYFGANEPPSGFDTDRDAFLGRFGDWGRPRAVIEETSYASVAHGRAPIAALRYDIVLSPGAEKTLVFRLGYGKNPAGDKFEHPGVIRKDDERRTARAYVSDADVERALEKLRAHWDALLGVFSAQTGDEKLDRTVNIWNQYQCMATFNVSRSASLYESGIGRGMGFRDGCQDILGFVHLIPARARERILDIAAIQFEDGSTYHQYQPLTKRGNGEVGSGFNDDPLWLVACTAAYIKETGDFSILSAPVPFDNRAGSEAPLMEHLRRSVGHTLAHRGPHGLPLIGRADWNDCLNLNCFSDTPGESFQTTANFESGVAESVFIAAMFVKYAGEYAALCQRCGLEDEAQETLAAAREMERAVEAHGWDGEWYLRAYDAFGNKVGSRECEEGRIYVEPQGFCVMAGIGLKDGKAERALASVRERLVGTYGIELLAPPYTRYHRELGEITSYPPGYKENGSVFAHNNPWVFIALSMLGRADEAFDYYRRICPAYLEESSDVRRTEPYACAQTIAGRASASEGEAKNSWLTGTAAWMFVFASQYLLGVAPEYDGLRIRPCLPAHIGEAKIKRRFRGALYEISVRRTGEYVLWLDGKKLTGDTVPFEANRAEYKVEVTV
ncbi:MAG TPA: glycosyl transferase, partial [Clostridia bacterium]|nr:glycosyl transferase [Clostridia bacterium]